MAGEDKKINLPVVLVAAICSGSVFLGVVTWMRMDAVNSALVNQHERRITILETNSADEKKSILILQQDTKHILESLEEIKFSLKNK